MTIRNLIAALAMLSLSSAGAMAADLAVQGAAAARASATELDRLLHRHQRWRRLGYLRE